jgi:hypothetical protein
MASGGGDRQEEARGDGNGERKWERRRRKQRALNR